MGGIGMAELGTMVGGMAWAGLAPFALLGLAIPYAVLRLRKTNDPDPQLGAKVALQYFFSVSILIFLTGLTVLMVDLVSRDEVVARGPFNDPPERDGLTGPQRTAFGLMISGALFALVHFLFAMGMTNKVNWPRIRRLFAGWRFAIHGMVVLPVATLTIVQLMQKDAFGPRNFEPLKSYFAVLIVWIPSWVIHLALMGMYRPTKADEAAAVEDDEAAD